MFKKILKNLLHPIVFMLCIFYRKLALRNFLKNNEKRKKNVIKTKETKRITYFRPIT